MLRWLWKIIVGEKPASACKRECMWQVMDRGKITDSVGVVGEWYTLRCETCGLLKNHENSQ